MYLTQEKVPPRLPSRIVEEDHAWSHLYRRAGDPAVAAQVVQYLRTDAEATRRHLALYLRCRQTLRTHKRRMARRQRIERSVRQFINTVITLHAAVVRWLVRHEAVRDPEMPGPIRSGSTVRRVRALTSRIEPTPAVSAPVEALEVRCELPETAGADTAARPFIRAA